MKKKIKKPIDKPAHSTWTWTQPLEDQLGHKIQALNDIVELADNIKDPEVFRKHAKRIAMHNASTSAKVNITWNAKEVK